MSSFLKLLFICLLACAPTAEAVCYAPPQNDASCSQRYGTYDGYGCADDKKCYWTGSDIYSEGLCLAAQTCTAAAAVQCQAPAQDDASCSQRHGTYGYDGYGCADDKKCYWTGSDIYSEGTCRAKQTCTDDISALSKGEKVQTGLMSVVIAVLVLIAIVMVMIAKAIIPSKDEADIDGQDQLAADTDGQDQFAEKRGWFRCCKKKPTEEEADENAVEAEDEKKAVGDNEDRV